MKNISTIGLCLALSMTGTHAQNGNSTPQITSTGANFNLWQWRTSTALGQGRVAVQNHSYQEVASGLNYQDPTTGQWVPSQAVIEPSSEGGIAQQGQHKVTFANDLNTAGAISDTTPDGKQLLSNLVGLMYYDPTTGQSAQIAQIQDSEGQLISDNQVLYTNAFNGADADVLMTYRIDGMEQDVVLRAQLPAPETFGFSSATVELETVTAFVDPPAASVWNIGTDTEGVEPDQAVSWGVTSLGRGRAFSLNGQDAGATVIKQYVNIDGEYYLLEKVRFRDIQQALSALPDQASNARHLPAIASKQLHLPKAPTGKPAIHPLRLARGTPGNKGYVLDYISLNTAYTNYDFQGDTTYYVSGNLNLSGTNTFEGGAVIKYAANAAINGVAGSQMKFISTPYDPVMFTAKDDNSVGDGISGSTGSPSGYYANPALSLGATGNVTLAELRVAYANQGLSVAGCSPSISDAQLVRCATAISDINGAVSLQNVLFSSVKTNFNATVYVNTISVQNGTFNNCFALTNGLSANTTLYLTNCAFVNVTNLTGNISAGYNGFYPASPTVGSPCVTSMSNPLQTIGAADGYLANGGTFTNAGTVNILPSTLKLLSAKTTHPPVVFDDIQFTTATNFGPHALRDNSGSPDLGYHYDPMDYVFAGCDLSATLTVAAGTAIGYFEDYGSSDFEGQPYSVALDNGANFTLNGTASAPCDVPLFRMVQEGINGNWSHYGYESCFLLNGSGSPPVPQITAQFTHWTGLLGWGFMGDYWDYGVVRLNGCEVYNEGIGGYASSYFVTNCLLFRTGDPFWDQENAATVTFQNCTFFNGALVLDRYSGQSPSFWTIINTTFDGTGFITSDNFNGNPTNTYFNYNRYNTNNTSWMNYGGLGSPCTNTLETVGPDDLTVSNYNWQSGLLGNFYLPADSPLIGVGNTTPALAGLAYFTSLTNQEPDGSVVNIGYHYPISGYVIDGLVAYWPLNDGYGTTAVDLIAGNNLTLMGTSLPTWGPGYLSFDGQSQYAAATNSTALSINGPITICAWVNSSNFPTAANETQVVVEKGADTSYNEAYFLRFTDYFDMTIGTYDAEIQSASFVPGDQSGISLTNMNSTGQWYFLTGVYDAPYWSLYVNGLLPLNGITTVPNGPLSNSAPLYVGARSYSGSPQLFFNGSIHDMGIYNRALSPEEIAANFLSTKLNTTAYPDLLYLKMLEGATNTTGPGPVSMHMADASTYDHTNVILTYPYTVEWLTNVAFVPNAALHFNGTASYIDIHDTNSFNFTTNPFTVNFWALTLTGQKYLFSNGGFLYPGTTNAVMTNGWYIKVGGSESILFGSGAPTGETFIASPNSVASTTTWNMVTCVWDGTNAYIYINGGIIAPVADNFNSPAPSNYSLVIGQDGSGANFYDGDMWLPQIWSTNLPAADIANLYLEQLQGILYP